MKILQQRTFCHRFRSNNTIWVNLRVNTIKPIKNIIDINIYLPDTVFIHWGLGEILFKVEPAI